MKQRVVAFNENGMGARVLVNPKEIPINSLVNPDVKHLKGVSPTFWKRQGNTVQAMTPAEQSVAQQLGEPPRETPSYLAIKDLVSGVETKLFQHVEIWEENEEESAKAIEALWDAAEELADKVSYQTRYAYETRDKLKEYQKQLDRLATDCSHAARAVAILLALITAALVLLHYYG